MSTKSEILRGKRSAKEIFEKRFRSFSKNSKGELVGNRYDGSREVMGGFWRYTGGRNPTAFSKGFDPEMRKIVARKMLKKRIARARSSNVSNWVARETRVF